MESLETPQAKFGDSYSTSQRTGLADVYQEKHGHLLPRGGDSARDKLGKNANIRGVLVALWAIQKKKTVLVIGIS